MRKYEFTFQSKCFFYFSYILYKVILYFECKVGRSRLYLAELIWTLNQFLGLNLPLPSILKRDYFETKFGKFYIVPDLVSTIAISPAFERVDVNFLLRLITASLQKNKKVLFIDIGANIGYYSVLIGNKFKKDVTIAAFEPSTSYLSLPSYELLMKNLHTNRIHNIMVYKVGIGSRNTKQKNKAGFSTKTLDSIIGKNYFKKFDDVFIKLDVDDFAIDALKGINECVTRGQNITLLVEDFVDKKTPDFLVKNKYVFLKKISPYNSFWIFK